MRKMLFLLAILPVTLLQAKDRLSNGDTEKKENEIDPVREVKKWYDKESPFYRPRTGDFDDLSKLKNDNSSEAESFLGLTILK